MFGTLSISVYGKREKPVCFSSINSQICKVFISQNIIEEIILQNGLRNIPNLHTCIGWIRPESPSLSQDKPWKDYPKSDCMNHLKVHVISQKKKVLKKKWCILSKYTIWYADIFKLCILRSLLNWKCQKNPKHKDRTK